MQEQLYFLFYEKGKMEDLNKNNKIDIVGEYVLELNETRFKRLFCTEKNFLSIGNYSQLYDVYIVKTSEYNEENLIEYEHYNTDCNVEIANIINTNKCIGFSSKYHNNIIKALLLGNHYTLKREKEIIDKLKGEEMWTSLEEYFNVLYIAGVNYVSLRKNEFLPYSFVENDKDIDILCDNKNEFIYISNAIKRSIGVSGYKINVNREWIPLDIRYKGDFYFDVSWEENILKNRIYNKNNISVMNSENQFFTILYHVLTQKKEIPQYYAKIINERYPNVNKQELLNILICFMKSNGYYYYKPLDISVYKNKNKYNVSIIKKILGNISTYKKIKIYIISKIPRKFFFEKIYTKAIEK